MLLVAGRKGEGHIVGAGYSSLGFRRVLVSRGAQTEEGPVVRHSPGEAVEHMADKESGLEGERMEDRGIEALVVLGCSHSHGPAGEDKGDGAG